MKKYTLRFSKPITAADRSDPHVKAAEHRALRTRRQAIKRQLRRTAPGKEERRALLSELQLLADIETQRFGVQHRATALPVSAQGKRYVPRTARGKVHVPLAALPLNARNRPYVPSVEEIVQDAIFKKFADKGNIATALARLAVVNPSRYKVIVETEAHKNSRLRRALNRARSDAKPQPPTAAERLVLENFYASEILRQPLCGMAWDRAADRLEAKTGVRMPVDKYRRILRKFFLA